MRIQSSSHKFRSKHFLLAIEAVEEQRGSRVGITVTTKLDKRAHSRNLLKRRIRELFRRASLPPGFDGVVIALTGALQLSYSELEGELCYLVRKAKRTLLPRESRGDAEPSA